MQGAKMYVAVTAIAGLLLSLVACSSQPAVTVTVTAPPAAAAPVEPSAAPSYIGPRNPVTLLKQIPNCEFAEGVVAGQYDISGNRFADCTIGDTGQKGHVVSLRTYPGDPKVLDPYPHLNLRSDDRSAVIIGDDFVAKVSAIYAGDKLDRTVAAEVKRAVGGEIVEPSLD